MLINPETLFALFLVSGPVLGILCFGLGNSNDYRRF